MSWFAIGATVVSVAFQAYSTISAGQAQKAAYNAKAQAGNQYATAIEASGRSQAEELKYRANIASGQIAGAAGGSGVTQGGSVMEMLQEQNRHAALNLSNLNFNTASSAYAARRDASLNAYYGSQAERASYISAAGTVLTGAMKAGGTLYGGGGTGDLGGGGGGGGLNFGPGTDLVTNPSYMKAM